MSKHIKLDTTVQNLEFDKSWKLLSEKEKNTLTSSTRQVGRGQRWCLTRFHMNRHPSLSFSSCTFRARTFNFYKIPLPKRE